MRVGLIRQDLNRVYLDDLENSSQRDFSSQPPGQSRYISFPTTDELTWVLNGYAFLSILATGGSYPLTISGSNNTLTVKTSATGTATSLTVASGTYASAAVLATQLNSLFAGAGLLVVASSQGGQIQIDTVAPTSPFIPSYANAYTNPSPPIGLSHEHQKILPLNSGPTAYLQLGGNFTSVAMTLSNTALTGLSVASLMGTSSNTGMYKYTAIAGQSGTTAAVASVSTNGTATITGLSGMTANSTLHYLVVSSASSSGNNGTFKIVQYISPTSVVIANPNAVAPDAGGADLHWTEDSVTFNISYSQIGALSTFSVMEGYSASAPTGSFLALATAIQNAIAPGLVETGPALLSFAAGKLSILSASYFQPGYPAPNGFVSPFGANESAVARLGYPAGAAVFITENDGVTAYTL